MAFSNAWTKICNRALGRLGAVEITGLDEGSAAASFCSTYLGDALGEALARYDWKCCTRRVRLAPDPEGPPFGWAYRFRLPVDFIRLVRPLEPPGPPPFLIEGAYIYANEKPLDLAYIALPEDPGVLSGSLARAVYTGLAYLLSTPMASNERLSARIAAERAEALERAMREDAQLNYDPLRFGVKPVEEARHG
jgi:hypothetical protein